MASGTVKACPFVRCRCGRVRTPRQGADWRQLGSCRAPIRTALSHISARSWGQGSSRRDLSGGRSCWHRVGESPGVLSFGSRRWCRGLRRALGWVQPCRFHGALVVIQRLSGIDDGWPVSARWERRGIDEAKGSERGDGRPPSAFAESRLDSDDVFSLCAGLLSDLEPCHYTDSCALSAFQPNGALALPALTGLSGPEVE